MVPDHREQRQAHSQCTPHSRHRHERGEPPVPAHRQHEIALLRNIRRTVPHHEQPPDRHGGRHLRGTHRHCGCRHDVEKPDLRRLMLLPGQPACRSCGRKPLGTAGRRQHNQRGQRGQRICHHLRCRRHHRTQSGFQRHLPHPQLLLHRHHRRTEEKRRHRRMDGQPGSRHDGRMLVHGPRREPAGRGALPLSLRRRRHQPRAPICHARTAGNHRDGPPDEERRAVLAAEREHHLCRPLVSDHRRGPLPAPEGRARPGI